jgi:hypothetical protein
MCIRQAFHFTNVCVTANDSTAQNIGAFIMKTKGEEV